MRFERLALKVVMQKDGDFMGDILLYVYRVVMTNDMSVLVSGAQILRPSAWQVVFLGGARHLLTPLPAAECWHRDLPRKPQ